MAVDWNKPTVSDNYSTGVLSQLVENIKAILMMDGPALVILNPLASALDDCLAPGTTPSQLAKADWLRKRVGSPTADKKMGDVCSPTPGIVRRLSEG